MFTGLQNQEAMIISFQVLKGCTFKGKKIRKSLCFVQVLSDMKGTEGENFGFFSTNMCVYAQAYMHKLKICAAGYITRYGNLKILWISVSLKINLVFYKFKNFWSY